MTQTYRMHLPPTTIEGADAEQRRVLERARERLGFVPNMYANMVTSPGLLETYMDGYERFRADSGFTPPEQEVVFLTISRINGCTYCMAAHSMLATKIAKLPAIEVEALRTGDDVTDPNLRALATFTEVVVESRGRPSVEATNAFLAAGFGERHVLEIVLALAVKTLSNYANHLFEPALDEPFAPFAWNPASARDAA